MNRAEKPKRILAAALRTEDGLIHFYPPPYRHHHVIHALNKNRKGKLLVAEGEQGFVTNEGNFLGREAAGQVAVASGQIKELSHPPYLYSEDLW